MDFQGFEDPAGKVSLLTVLTLLAAAALKVFWRLKGDSRADAAGDRESRADALRHEGYGAIIGQLRTEVSRLASAVDEIEQKLRDEQRARFAVEQTLATETRARVVAEDKAGRLQDRVEQLEREIGILRGDMG